MNMYPIKADPEKLRGFAGDLKKFNETILQTIDKLNRETNRLGNSWRDQEFEKFRSNFIPTVQALKEFTGESEKLIPKLRKHADSIEEYQKKNI